MTNLLPTRDQIVLSKESLKTTFHCQIEPFYPIQEESKEPYPRYQMLASQIEYPSFLLPAQESRCCCQQKLAQLAIFEDVEEAVEA